MKQEDAAIIVLMMNENKPMHYIDITDQIIKLDLCQFITDTPPQSMGTSMRKSSFVENCNYKTGMYCLRDGWEEEERNVRLRKKHSHIFPAKPSPFIPEEIPESSEGLSEGTATSIRVNAYERNPSARDACLRHYGFRCTVCDFLFEDEYGSIGERYIHVHHLVPLTEIGKAYKIHPIKDLRPVCPNCHAMLHKRSPPYTIQELKEIRDSLAI